MTPQRKHMTPLPTNRRRAMLTGSVALAAAPLLTLPTAPWARADAAAATRQVLDHHLGAFAKGLDAIMADYTAGSAILTHDKQYRGLAEIRGFFDGFLKGVKPGFWEAFKINAQTIDRDVAYLVWEAKPFVNLATDTLVVRDRKIVVQTFTAG
jgi:hypothetical protein